MLSMICEAPLTKFVILEDTVRLCGQPLFLSLISNHNSKNSINMICLENHPSYYKGKLKDFDNITFIDCFSNCTKDLVPAIKMMINLNTDSIVVIDSLSDCITLIDNIYSTLREILQNRFIIQIIALLHTDCIFSPEISTNIKHIATAVVTINSIANHNTQICSLLLRRPGRKVVKEDIAYWFDEKGQLQSSVHKPKKTPLAATEENFPADLSTFRIKLNEDEKKSRDEIVLPYMKTSDDQVHSTGGGKVIYELEPADDWDEEDPDDDLDI